MDQTKGKYAYTCRWDSNFESIVMKGMTERVDNYTKYMLVAWNI